MTRKNKLSLVQTSFALALILLITKSIGFLREIIFAGEFGTSRNFDFYLIGAVIPIMINTVFFYLAQNYFIPNYFKNKKEGNKSDSQFFNESFWLFVLFGFILSLILFSFSNYIMKFYTEGLTEPELKIVWNIFNLIVFTIPLNTGFSVASSYFSANNKLHIPYLTQLANNSIILFIIIILSSFWGIYAIPIAYIIANTFQLGFVLFIIKKYVRLSFPSISTFKSISFISFSSFTITVMIEFFSLSYMIIDRYFFPNVDQGGISAYNYALTIFNLPISIFGATVAAILLPKFSSNFQNKNEDNSFEKGIEDSLNAIVIFLMPIVVLFILHSSSMVKIIFQRGAFNSNDTLMTAELLVILSFGLIFYAAYSVINKILYSTQYLKLFLLLVLFTIIVKFLFNSIYVDDLKQNALALSTIICYIILLVGGILIVIIKLKTKFHKSFLINLIRILILAIAIYIVSNTLSKIFFDYSLTQEIFQMFLFVVIYFSTIYFADKSENSITRKVFYSLANFSNK